MSIKFTTDDVKLDLKSVESSDGDEENAECDEYEEEEVDDEIIDLDIARESNENIQEKREEELNKDSEWQFKKE